MNQTNRDWYGKNVVYRCFGESGELLYVGVTANLPRRMDNHRREAAWYPAFARLRVQVFPDYTTALAAEREAIKLERPLLNVRSSRAAGHAGTKRDPRRIRPAGPALIRDYLEINRSSVRDLAELCGGAKHRAAIGHLLSGHRDTCGAALAEALQGVVCGDDVELFEPTRHLRIVA